MLSHGTAKLGSECGYAMELRRMDFARTHAVGLRRTGLDYAICVTAMGRPRQSD